MPESKRRSALSRSAPRGLLKNCGALNQPNYHRFGCKGETKAENYTCRMENNRETADNKGGEQMRQTGRQTERERERETGGKLNNDLCRLHPPDRSRQYEGKELRQRDFFVCFLFLGWR